MAEINKMKLLRKYLVEARPDKKIAHKNYDNMLVKDEDDQLNYSQSSADD